MKRQQVYLQLACCLVVAWVYPAAAQLPSWSDTAPKKAIVDFVQRVTTEGSDDYLPPEQRIAVFDNDGTLWCESPLYVQLAFTADRVKAMAADHPEWRTTEPFKSLLADDWKGVVASGDKGMLELLAATHSGMTVDEFYAIVIDWLKTTWHPRFNRPYWQCVYQPQIELLQYLREHGFTTYIVSGGGIDFMRPWAERVYGIPPHQVIGSSIKSKYEVRDGKPVIVKLPQVDFIDDHAGKPVGIQRFIGQRPCLAVGNSDGDYEMLEYVTVGRKPSLGLLIHHTDPDREYAYDREGFVGRLDRGLADADKRHWIVVDMRRDWETVFPPVTPVEGR